MTTWAGLVTRVTRAWAAWYTAGLPRTAGSDRCDEIDSDLAEHHRARTDEGWGASRTAREQLWRTVRGVPADLAWRHDVLAEGYRSNAAVRAVVLGTTSIASLAVAAFYVAFAAYLLGNDSLSGRPFLGGLDHYAEETGSTSAALVAVAVLALGGAIVASCAIRPVSPLAANAAAIGIAMWSVLWFWLGAAPIGLVVVAGAVVDMTLRAPALRSGT